MLLPSCKQSLKNPPVFLRLRNSLLNETLHALAPSRVPPFSSLCAQLHRPSSISVFCRHTPAMWVWFQTTTYRLCASGASCLQFVKLKINKKAQHLWNAIKPSAIKQGMPVLASLFPPQVFFICSETCLSPLCIWFIPSDPSGRSSSVAWHVPHWYYSVRAPNYKHILAFEVV